MKTSRRAAPPRSSTSLKTAGAAARTPGRASSATAEPPSGTKTTKAVKAEKTAKAGNPGGAGVVLGLALTRTGATAATVECLPLAGRGKIILTGNLVGSARDAAHVAVSLARARAKTLGLDPALFFHTDLHFHVMDPLPPKGGPSIGLPMFVALVSALTRTPVDPTFAFTGELSLTGKILAVEGIGAKVKAAARAGVTMLYAPAENVKERKGKGSKELDLVGVETVDSSRLALATSRGHSSGDKLHV